VRKKCERERDLERESLRERDGQRSAREREKAMTAEASRVPRKTGSTPLNGGQVRAAAAQTVAARTPHC